MTRIRQEYDPAVPVGALQEHPENPRRGDVEVIAASMRAHGFYGAVYAQRSTGRIVAGNHRHRVARQQGQETVPVIWLDVDDDQARRILLVDNRSADLGGYDDAALEQVLRELCETELGLVGTAYTAEDLAELFGDPDPDSAGGGDPDAVPESASARTQRGDIWLLGPHRLICGDCTQLETVQALDAVNVDLILTDPPYCSGGFQEVGRSRGSVGTDAPHKQIANDRLSTRGYQALLRSAFAASGAEFAYVFTDWRMWVNLFDVIEASGFGVRSMIVWDKGSPGMGRQWRSQHELVMWAAKATPPYPKHDPAAGNVIQAQRTGNDLHTTQKPIELLEALLTNTPFAETIYDPFAGSGSTLIAALRLGRLARLVELDPAYCDVICRRWQEYTGVVPVLEATGETHDFTA